MAIIERLQEQEPSLPSDPPEVEALAGERGVTMTQAYRMTGIFQTPFKRGQDRKGK